MKKVLLSTLLALLCSVKVFACYPPIEAAYPCLKTELINGRPVQVITVFIYGDCYGEAIDPSLPLPSHGYLWYKTPGSSTITGFLAPYSETYIYHPVAFAYGWEVKYIVPSYDPVPQYQCALFWFEMWPDGYTPVTPPNSYTINGDPGTTVCPCEDDAPCRADFNYCVTYDAVNAKWNTVASPFDYPTWIDYYQMTVDGTPVTTTMPGNYTFTGGSHTICIEAFYYSGTKSCKKCMEVCFPAEPKPGRESTAIGQLNNYISEVKLYPNPASNMTKLEFNLTESEELSIELMDISGRVIKTIRKEQSAAGYHAIEINTADVPSGMYIIRMETGKASANYRLSIIK